MVAPPLPDVDGLSPNRAGLIVVRPLAHHPIFGRAVEGDEGEVRQVDVMDLDEDLLPQSDIRYRLFLFVESIQGRVAIEVNVRSIGRELVARPTRRIVGVIGPVIRKLSDVVPARYGPVGGDAFPPGKKE